MLDLLIIVLAEDPPEPSQVKAGPLGFAVWIFLVLAVVVIGFSLVKQLRRAEANRKAGVFGDVPESGGDSGGDIGSGDIGGGDGGGGGGD